MKIIHYVLVTLGFIITLVAHSQSALHDATSNDEIETMLDLIQQNAQSVDVVDTKKETALHRAAKYSYLKAAQLLLDHGAKPNLKNQHGETPLHLATYALDYNMVRLLLDYGASANIPDNKGMTPFTWAHQRDPELLSIFTYNNLHCNQAACAA